VIARELREFNRSQDRTGVTGEVIRKLSVSCCRESGQYGDKDCTIQWLTANGFAGHILAGGSRTMLFHLPYLRFSVIRFYLTEPSPQSKTNCYGTLQDHLCPRKVKDRALLEAVKPLKMPWMEC
jgi:hypothetical protein